MAGKHVDDDLHQFARIKTQSTRVERQETKEAAEVIFAAQLKALSDPTDPADSDYSELEPDSGDEDKTKTQSQSQSQGTTGTDTGTGRAASSLSNTKPNHKLDEAKKKAGSGAGGTGGGMSFGTTLGGGGGEGGAKKKRVRRVKKVRKRLVERTVITHDDGTLEHDRRVLRVEGIDPFVQEFLQDQHSFNQRYIITLLTLLTP